MLNLNWDKNPRLYPGIFLSKRVKEFMSGMKSEHVILLHGLGRGAHVMRKLNSYLMLQGYQSHNIDYPSRSAKIETLAEGIYKQIQPLLTQKENPVHFIGHSLGGILIRYILQTFEVNNLGRVVMIAPPNHGSEVAEYMKKFSFYRRTFGPAGLQLGTKQNAFLQSLHDPNYEVGVIAGDRSIDLLFSWLLLPGPNDGKVTIESTKLRGMCDHITVHAPHPFIPSFQSAIDQAHHFIKHGRFSK